MNFIDFSDRNEERLTILFYSVDSELYSTMSGWGNLGKVKKRASRETEPRPDGITFANMRLRLEMKRDLPAYRNSCVR
jgi:hypothetical protein